MLLKARNFDAQSAYRAWTQISPGSPSPTRIDLLKPHRLGKWSKSYVFRMHGAGQRGSPVIAKLCRTDTGILERTIYQDVLAVLPIDSLDFYGSVAEPGANSLWLFLEDAGEHDPHGPNDEDRLLASGWLGAFHAMSHSLSKVVLPRRDAAYFLNHLRHAREAILENEARGSFDSQVRRLLRSVAVNLALVENQWGDIERRWEGLPHAVVHGDFRVKHIKPFAQGEVTRIGVLDWEMAGWGPIALDLATLKAHRTAERLESYLANASVTWPDLTVEALAWMGELGYLLKCITSVYWATATLVTRYPEGAVADLSRYNMRLAESLDGDVWVGVP